MIRRVFEALDVRGLSRAPSPCLWVDSDGDVVAAGSSAHDAACRALEWMADIWAREVGHDASWATDPLMAPDIRRIFDGHAVELVGDTRATHGVQRWASEQHGVAP